MRPSLYGSLPSHGAVDEAQPVRLLNFSWGSRWGPACTAPGASPCTRSLHRPGPTLPTQYLSNISHNIILWKNKAAKLWSSKLFWDNYVQYAKSYLHILVPLLSVKVHTPKLFFCFVILQEKSHTAHWGGQRKIFRVLFVSNETILILNDSDSISLKKKFSYSNEYFQLSNNHFNGLQQS